VILLVFSGLHHNIIKLEYASDMFYFYASITRFIILVSPYALNANTRSVHAPNSYNQVDYVSFGFSSELQGLEDIVG
jgi:hypothetical protein